MRIDFGRVADLTNKMENALRAKVARSAALFERASQILPAGVPSSFQDQPPHPIYISGGEGTCVRDLDGNSYTDFHNGFGVMVMGHAHPTIVKAMREAAGKGTHFAMPTESAVRVAEELSRRFGLPKVRFANSGTESTLEAVHLARAFTGRDVIVKIEGSYHGHHDSVMVSVHPDPTQIGPRETPASVPFTAGIPRALVELTLVVSFNDPDALAVLLASRDDVAGVIIEPIMLNIGVIKPNAGYLEALREITMRHGAVLIFDEVKTGATIAAGGVVERYGVTPDVVCLAKAIGGGTPIGAILGTEEIMGQISDGTVKQLGTFNGNPLTMAAAEATLTRVLDKHAYRRLEEAGKQMVEGCQAICDQYGLPAYAVGVSAKGCVMFTEKAITDYRSYAENFLEPLNYLAWLYHMNNGVMMTPGADEQWTLSIAHTDEELDHYVSVFEEFARDITLK